ncbi:hypothetical protein GCM10027082_00750 [Comamonas humi]
MPHRPASSSTSPRIRWRALPAALAAALLLSACSPEDGGRSAETAAPAAPIASAAPPAPLAAMERARRAPVAELALAKVQDAAGGAAGAAAPAQSQRHLAVRHQMQVETPAASLSALWEAVRQRCEQLDCQVEESALQRETPHAAARAYLNMRVNPRDFAALTSALGGEARVLSHQTTSEDKTAQVVDVEAQIKNRSEYRDSLRELLREKGVKRTLSDLMEIRDTLSRVQAEIDAAQTQRALLARETTKQLVQMGFVPQAALLSGTYSPWQRTWSQSWRTFNDSARALVVTAAGALPWLVLLALLGLPALALGRRWLRQRRAKAVPVVQPQK